MIFVIKHTGDCYAGIDECAELAHSVSSSDNKIDVAAITSPRTHVTDVSTLAWDHAYNDSCEIYSHPMSSFS